MSVPSYQVDIATLLQNFSSSIFVVNQAQEVITWNNRLVHYSGIDAGNAIGQTFAALFTDMEGSRIHQAIAKNLELGMPAAISNVLNKSPFPLYVQSATNYQRIAQSITITRVVLQGENCCLVDIADVTPAWIREQALEKQVLEKKRAEKTLQTKRKQLQSALDAASAGIFCYDLPTNIVSWDEKACAILGCSDGVTEDSYEKWLLQIHPNDRASFDRHFKANIQGEHVSRIDLEYRQNVEGEERWVAVKALIVRNQQDDVIAVSGMIQDITVYWRQLNLLQEKTTAELANNAKSVFLSNISHQLRTPLHAILGYAQLGNKKCEAASLQKIQEYFKRIQSGGEQLNVLLNELVELSELQDGNMKMLLKEHVFSAMIERCLADLSVRINSKNITIKFENKLGEINLLYDEFRMSRAFTHLLENAIKFSDANNPIKVCVSKVKEGELDYVSVVIKDRGIGVPETELEKIFRNFEVSSRTDDGSGNRGVGLSYCRGVILSHRGKVWMENNKGAGVSVKVLLPFSDSKGCF